MNCLFIEKSFMSSKRAYIDISRAGIHWEVKKSPAFSCLFIDHDQSPIGFATQVKSLGNKATEINPVMNHLFTSKQTDSSRNLVVEKLKF